MKKLGINKWIAIRRHMTRPESVNFLDYSLATIRTKTQTIYISKTSTKFRLKSYLDWAYYTPKTLALALEADDLDVYYETQLHHQNSDPNIWKRWDEEQDLKSYYAARAGRATRL